MLIALVTEFPQDSYFQWYREWSYERQLANNVLVKAVMMNPQSLRSFPHDHGYWDTLREADFIFVYCSRSEQVKEYIEAGTGIKKPYLWWSLPLIVKTFMKPSAKMVSQWDDDWIWLFHPDWTWWTDKPDNHGGPEKFFKETGILDVSDVIWTVLDHPDFEKYTTKPVRYMPLPHLWRYFEQPMKWAELGYDNSTHYRDQRNKITVIRHSSHVAECYHTLENVVAKIGMPALYFAQGIPKIFGNVKVQKMVNRHTFMEIVSENTFVGIDDAENYIGWSRFGMECAILYIPCIGSTKSVKQFFPDLYTEHKDYKKQIELIKRLRSDKEFYNNVVKKGRELCTTELNPDRLCKEMVKTAEELGVPHNEEVYDMDLVIFMDVLEKLLPFATVPKRPSDTQTVWDDYHKRQCSQADWDQWYGRFEKFISDEERYKVIIKEVIERKDRKTRGVVYL